MSTIQWGTPKITVEKMLDPNPNLHLKNAEIALKDGRYENALEEIEYAYMLANGNYEVVKQCQKVKDVLYKIGYLRNEKNRHFSETINKMFSKASSNQSVKTEKITSQAVPSNFAKTIYDYQSYVEELKRYYEKYRDEMFYPSKLEDFRKTHPEIERLNISKDDIAEDLRKIRTNFSKLSFNQSIDLMQIKSKPVFSSEELIGRIQQIDINASIGTIISNEKIYEIIFSKSAFINFPKGIPSVNDIVLFTSQLVNGRLYASNLRYKWSSIK